MLDKLERSKLAKWAIPNLTMYLVAGQAAAWLITKAEPSFYAGLVLMPARVLQGEVWRLVSFMFMPPPADMLFGDLGVVFGLILLFIFGRGLEAIWGAVRFNAFLLVGWLASAAVSFVSPYGIATNFFLMESVFLAFAYLNPNYELLMFFVLPVKVKWLAALVWLQFAYMGVTAAMGGLWMVTAMVVAGVVNFFLFFGGDMLVRLRGAGRRTTKRVEVARAAKTATHTCHVCKKSDLTEPTMTFRYCSKCAGGKAYCSEHLRAHEHVLED